MSGIVGTANTRSEIALTFNGVTDWFPTPENQEDAEFGAGDIQTSTLESFSPSVVSGDPTVISNDVLAAMTWSNFADGMGTLQYAPQEGTGSLDSFRSSGLDTRFPNMAILPPANMSLGTLAVPYTVGAYVGGAQPSFAATGDATWPIICHGDALYPSTPCSIQKMNTSMVWTAVNFPNMGPYGDYVTYLQYNGLHVFATGHGIVYSSDLVTFTQGWWPGPCTGLVVHDNKLYTFAIGKVHWTLDPTGTTAWPFHSTDNLRLGPGEYVLTMAEWKTRQASRSLYILTTARICAYDDDDFFAEFFTYGKYIAGPGADLAVWIQDKGMYFAPGDDGANVIAFQNQTVSNISPAKKGGLLGVDNFAIVRLRGGLNWLFAQTASPSVIDAIGINATTTGLSYGNYSYRGDIIGYNGRGWHTLMRGNAAADTDPASAVALTGMSYFKNQIVYLRGNNRVETLYVPDSAVPPIHNNGPITYRRNADLNIVSGRTDAALKAVYKTGRFWEVQIERPDGTVGMPAGCTAQLSWTHDGVTATFPQMNSGTTFPARFSCDSVADAGVPWRTISWQLTMTNSSGAANVTPVLRSVTHYYLRSPNLIDGYQFRIDLSERRFEAINGTWRGRDRLYLYNRLMAIKNAKTNVAFQYGTEGDPVVVPAAEVRVAGQLSGGIGSGIFTVTARDISTPASG